ncbi:FmdE family protein [Arcobacter sp. 15-2]|uniref:FmdE family protein n=1 Tax=Arcobacter sp. 15-2 TaxID=3374109 RepID=UPI00399C8635
MNYPKFFNTIETIKLQDPLSNLLGTFENGLIEFSYLDVVKNAGHSCPTVAGAYLLALEGIKALYENDTPVRGEIFVSFSEDSSEGVAGVIANVLSHITGATESLGFKGLNGNFVRHDLMQFNAEISSSIKLQRLDTGKTVELIYNPSSIEQNPQVGTLMQKIMQNIATPEEKKLFGTLWQERVENIFKNIPQVIKVV